MASPDWRSGAGFDWSEEQGERALAWELLRLNPEFRTIIRSDPDAAALARAGGCDFAADPELGWREAEVFWRPELAADVVVCAASPRPLSSGPKAHELIDRARAATWADDGAHLLWQTGEQLWLAAPVAASEPVLVVLPFDHTHARRAAAADRAWRRLAGQPQRVARKPSAQTRRQLLLKLCAITGRQAGASHREIAIALFGRDRVPSGAAWKTSDLRSRTLRLVGEGRRLMNGGYLGLLA